jgi:hypothetical protein
VLPFASAPSFSQHFRRHAVLKPLRVNVCCPVKDVRVFTGTVVWDGFYDDAVAKIDEEKLVTPKHITKETTKPAIEYLSSLV